MRKSDNAHEIWWHYRLLDEIARDENLSQRELSRRLGVAVGRTNQVIKRLVRKGLVKTRQVNAKRVAYYLTPHGFSEKLQLVVRYSKITVDFFSSMRLVINNRLEELQKSDSIRTAAIVGTSELAEAAYLSLREMGIDLAAVYDLNGPHDKWLGLKVLRLEDRLPAPVDVVLVTEMDELGEAGAAVETIGRNVVEIRELLSERLALFACRISQDDPS